MIPLIHSFVTHSKMPELGIGEILTTDGQRMSIRFASGERNFVCALVSEHLIVTTSAPPAPAAKKARAPRAKKAAAAK